MKEGNLSTSGNVGTCNRTFSLETGRPDTPAGAAPRLSNIPTQTREWHGNMPFPGYSRVRSVAPAKSRCSLKNVKIPNDAGGVPETPSPTCSGDGWWSDWTTELSIIARNVSEGGRIFRTIQENSPILQHVYALFAHFGAGRLKTWWHGGTNFHERCGSL
jgi:hypothetical protein